MPERGQQQVRGEWRVGVGGEETSAVYEQASDGSDWGVCFIFAHGAGGNMNDRGVLQTTNALRARGLDVVRFNFLYKEKKSGRPDPMPRLKETLAAVIVRTRDEVKPRFLIIGGRSMGGRAASMIAADGFECDGLLLLAYPLHPPGKPENLRIDHFPKIDVPCLFVSGTRDAFGTPDELAAHVKAINGPVTFVTIDGAGHDLKGKSDEVVDVTLDWLKTVK